MFVFFWGEELRVSVAPFLSLLYIISYYVHLQHETNIFSCQRA